MNGNMNQGAVPVLSVRNLKKRIGGKWIIKGVSFDVYPGEIFGFLGPNGSGKTTTIRMLVDLIRPTEGTIEIGGLNLRSSHDQALSLVGSIVENPELYPYLTGWENLETFAGMLKGVGAERIAEVVRIVGMEARIHDKVKTYSLGMRQRLGIAQALLGRPKLLILDEPTNGLDPQGIKELREFIRGLASDGLSIFISSHLLSEIQLMCDRVAIIRKGEAIAVGRVDELLQQQVRRVLWRAEPLAEARAFLAAREGVRVLGAAELPPEDAADQRAVLAEMDPEDVPDTLENLLAQGIRVFAVEKKNPTLEDMFLTLTEGETIG